jgi:hypothetical protein
VTNNRTATKKTTVKRSALTAVLATLAVGAVTVPARADDPGHPGEHMLMVHVPAGIHTIGLVGTDGLKNYRVVTPNAWNWTSYDVTNGSKVSVWGYTVSDPDARTTANQKYYDEATVPSDRLSHFWFTLHTPRKAA